MPEINWIDTFASTVTLAMVECPLHPSVCEMDEGVGEIREPSSFLTSDLVSKIISYNVNIQPKIFFFFFMKVQVDILGHLAGVAFWKDVVY